MHAKSYIQRKNHVDILYEGDFSILIDTYFTAIIRCEILLR